jgi:hypothetical protein
MPDITLNILDQVTMKPVSMRETVPGSGIYAPAPPAGSSGGGVVAAAADIHLPAAATAAVVSYAAGAAGVRHVVSGIAWSYSGVPTAGNLKVEDGATTIFSIDIVSAGPGAIPFPAPRKGSAATAMTVTLTSGGTGITGKLNVLGHWTE